MSSSLRFDEVVHELTYAHSSKYTWAPSYHDTVTQLAFIVLREAASPSLDIEATYVKTHPEKKRAPHVLIVKAAAAPASSHDEKKDEESEQRHALQQQKTPASALAYKQSNEDAARSVLSPLFYDRIVVHAQLSAKLGNVFRSVRQSYASSEHAAWVPALFMSKELTIRAACACWQTILSDVANGTLPSARSGGGKNERAGGTVAPPIPVGVRQLASTCVQKFAPVRQHYRDRARAARETHAAAAVDDDEEHQNGALRPNEEENEKKRNDDDADVRGGFVSVGGFGDVPSFANSATGPAAASNASREHETMEKSEG